MLSSNTRKPVMDISGRRPASTPVRTPALTTPVETGVPGATLPVREEPRLAAGDNHSPSNVNPSQNGQLRERDESTPALTPEPEKPILPRQKPEDIAPVPTGAIVGAVLIMVVLSAVTIMIYLKSK